jgi:SAM-dependent methyltransferase
MDDREIVLLDDLELTHFWYKARKNQLKRWFAELGSSKLSVLDLGSATGGNSLYISKLGHAVTSVEFSDLGVKIQKDKGIPVVQADARNLPFADSSFDVVICLDVLEHIVEDLVVVFEIKRVLKHGGHFLISVPEDQKLWSAHDVAVNHVRRYSKSSLLELLRQNRLTCNRIWSTLFLLRPSIQIARKFTRGSDLKKMNYLLNQFFYLVCCLELLLPKHRGKGVTLWVDGHKEY